MDKKPEPSNPLIWDPQAYFWKKIQHLLTESKLKQKGEKLTRIKFDLKQRPDFLTKILSLQFLGLRSQSTKITLKVGLPRFACACDT